jgi:MFS family permease
VLGIVSFSLMGYSYAVLLPIFAAQVLHDGAATLGWLTGASGIGAFVSALSLAVRKSVIGLTLMLQVAAAMLGGTLILFGLSHTLWLSLALMVFVGFGLMQGASASNTIIQSLVPEDKRARSMSYYTMAFFGAAPRQPASHINEAPRMHRAECRVLLTPSLAALCKATLGGSR